MSFSLVSKVFSRTRDIAGYLASSLVGSSYPGQLENEDDKTSRVACDAFSRTGVISDAQKQWSETANPSYARFNCQRTSIATAIMLETGATSSVSVRPFIHCNANNIKEHCPELFDNLSPDRNYFKFSGTKEDLEGVMRFLGSGTHAIVDVEHRQISGVAGLILNPFISGTGHLFNCAVVKNKGRDNDFKIIETYGGSYTKKADSDPDGFFEGYNRSIEAIIFYDNTPDKNELLELRQNFLNAIHAESADEHEPSPPARDGG